MHPTTIAYWVATVAFFAWFLSGRVRTPLRGGVAVAAYFTFIVLLNRI